MSQRPTRLAAVSGVLLSTGLACVPPTEDTPPEATSLFADVTVDVVLSREDGLLGPRDLDFNPEVEGELWVINRTDDAAITVRNVGTTEQTSERRKDPYALHFMEETSSISFSTGMKFGTCGESRNTYDNQAAPNDFMGPALWSADDSIFAISNPEAVQENGFDLGSHLDMMHETPLCMGITWVEDNVYFVYEGLTGTIARYDFKTDHGPGFDFHGDGTVERFTDVEVGYVEDVPSHIVYDHARDVVYVADTANSRVLTVDVSSALQVREFRGFETMVQESEGATVAVFAGAGAEGEAAVDLQLPSGLAIFDDILFIGDNLSSTIYAFDLESHALLDTVVVDEISEGGLMGLRVHPGGDDLYIVDFNGDQVLRLAGLAR